jgi:hypothetical protein
MRGGTESFQAGHATKGGLGGIQIEMDVHALLDAHWDGA